MFISKMHLSRRTMLRGLGATLALPLLDSMVPALTAQTATAAAPVRRLGVFYVPNGMSMPYWLPKAEGPIGELPPTLASLAKHRDRVLLCGGLADEAANLVKGGGDHARSAGTFLTCVPFKITAGADVFAAVSMDQIAAAEFAKQTQLASLELGIESNAMLGACDGGASCAYTNTIAWRTPTTPLPIENDPRAVFERLFGTSGSTDPGRACVASSATRASSISSAPRSGGWAARSGRATRPSSTSTSRRCATSSAASRWPSSRTRASCRSSISRSACRPTTPSTPS